ncbi:hypothetical protein [Pseudonocardia parietis]|uniref:Phage-related protein n=1 Tax=Pseudonocardia parietis TaxID=570936 RepID=A0ABS4W279_9PSEU|nr:hypothetical protein [Pseudonocardia parietis]MBP2370218.1 phage-related protein [Pseudonocardia parietis]
MADKSLGYSVTAVDRASQTFVKMAVQVDRLAQRLDELDRKRVSVTVDADTTRAQAKIQTLDKSFGSATIRVAALGRALSTLALPGAIVAATPAIASLGASAVTATGALWLLPAAATAGGVAMAALKVGMSGFGDALSNLGDSEKFAEAIAKLSPAAREAATTIRALVPAWTAMQQVVQENLFAGVAASIRELAGTYLPMLTAGLGGTATALNRFAQNFAAFAMAPQTLADVPYLFTNINTAITNLAPVVNNLMGAFRDIAVVGSTFLPGLATGAVNATQRFQTLVHTARETGQLAVWIQNGINTLRELGQLTGNVGSILGSVFGAAAASGESFLSMLVRVTGQMAAALKTPEGAAALTEFFVTVRTVVGLLWEKLVQLWPAISAAGQAFAALLIEAFPLSNVIFGLVATGLVPLLDTIRFLAPVLGPALVLFGLFRVAMVTTTAAMTAYRIATGLATAASVGYRLALGTNLVLTQAQAAAEARHTAAKLAGAAAGRALAAAQWLMNSALLANPITWVVVAIAALVAALVLAWQHSETFRAVVTAAWTAIQAVAMTVFGAVRDFIVNAWNVIQGAFTAVMGFIAPYWNTFWSGLQAVVAVVWAAIQAAVQFGWALVQAVFTAAVAFLAPYWDGFWSGLSAVVAVVWAAIQAAVSVGWAVLQSVFQVAVAVITALWNHFWPGLRLAVEITWAAIQAVVSVAWAVIQGIFGVAVAVLTGVWNVFWAGLRLAVDVVWASIQATVQIGWAVIQGIFQVAVAVLTSVWNVFWTALTGIASIAFAAVQGVVQTVWAVLQGVFQVGIAFITGAWNIFWGALQMVATVVFNAVVTMVGVVWAVLRGIFQTFSALLQGDWQGAWDAIRNTAITIWNLISSFFTTAFAAFQAFFVTVWTAVSTFFGTIWTAIQNIAITVWTAISTFFIAAFTAFQAFFTAVWNAVSLIFTTVWTAIQTTAMTIWNAIVAFFTTAFAAWTEFFQVVWDAIAAIFTAVWNALRDTAVAIWDAIVAFFTAAFAAFTTFFTDTWNNIVGIFDRVWSGITDIAGRVWESVKGVFIDGINWVIRKINAFAGAINRVAGLLGFDINLGIAEIPRQEGGPIARRDGGPIGLAAGGGVNAATGGLLPGRHRPGRDQLPAVAGAQHYRLDGGEYVVRRESTSAIGPAGMAAINNASQNPVDIVPRRGGGATHLAAGGPVLPESTVRAHMPFLSALKDGQAEAVQAANVFGGRDKFLEALAEDDERAKRAVGKPRRGMPGYRTQFRSSMLTPIKRDLGGAIAFARSMHGRPYIWGGTTTAGTDCSGYQGMITRVLRNQSPARIGSTHDFPWPGFVNGLGSAYSVGSFKGNPGHMAGTLAGVNVESGGSPSMVKYGAGAAGADSGQFGIRAHLPEAGGVFASGGGAGSGGLSFGAMARAWLDPLYRILLPIRDNHAEGLANRSGAGGGVWLMDKIVAAADALGGGGGADSAGIAVGGPVVDQVRAIANSFGWGSGPEWDALSWIIHHESGWDPNAANPTSSARGLFQKMTSIHGPVEPTASGQAQWGLNYIRGRYGSPTAAKRFWEANNHYDRGGIASGRGLMWKDTISPERVLDPRQTRQHERLTDVLTSGAGQRFLALAGGAAGGRGVIGPSLTVKVDNPETLAALARVSAEVATLQRVIREARAVNVYARNEDTTETGRAVALQMRL